jgi:hypothetical protein
MASIPTHPRQSIQASERARKHWAVVRSAFLESYESQAVTAFLEIGQVGLWPRPLAARFSLNIFVFNGVKQKRSAALAAVAAGIVKTDAYNVSLKEQGDLSLYTIVRHSFLC